MTSQLSLLMSMQLAVDNTPAEIAQHEYYYSYYVWYSVNSLNIQMVYLDILVRSEGMDK